MPCAVCSAELTEAVPVIADWIAVQIACETSRPRRCPPSRRPARAQEPAGDADVTAVGVPYFQWDNRDGGPMRVWMPEAG